jgi:hypothetical protein
MMMMITKMIHHQLNPPHLPPPKPAMSRPPSGESLVAFYVNVRTRLQNALFAAEQWLPDREVIPYSKDVD